MERQGTKGQSRTDDALTSLLTALPFPQRRKDKAHDGHVARTLADSSEVAAASHDRRSSHQSAGPSVQSEVKLPTAIEMACHILH